MTAATPRRRYLPALALGLAIVLAGLLLFVFGVDMEATATALGTITARDLQDVRAPFTGLIEPGWYEAEVSRAGGARAFRLDGQGNGLFSAAGDFSPVRHFSWECAGKKGAVDRAALRFHRLRTGDLLWPGQVVAVVHPGQWWQFRFPAALQAPAREEGWLAVDVPVESGQAVTAGQVVAVLVPVDAQGRPKGLIARMEVEETHAAEVQPGQTVRVSTNLYADRVYGTVPAVVERIEPLGHPGPDGKRSYRVDAAIGETPLRLLLGSGLKGEIILGRKRVYRIILEH
jgi:HlyD family secretion protein